MSFEVTFDGKGLGPCRFIQKDKVLVPASDRDAFRKGPRTTWPDRLGRHRGGRRQGNALEPFPCWEFSSHSSTRATAEISDFNIPSIVYFMLNTGFKGFPGGVQVKGGWELWGRQTVIVTAPHKPSDICSPSLLIPRPQAGLTPKEGVKGRG